MTKYTVTAEARGAATVTVEAETEAQACDIAYKNHLTGIIIDGGEAGWEITDVEEA